VYQLLFQAQITLLLLYSTTHLFNKKKKAAKIMIHLPSSSEL